MTVERTIQGYRITDTICGKYVTWHYIGYTRKESITEFRDMRKDLKQGIK